MRIYQDYMWLVLASLILHISTVAARRSSGRSSSSRSSSSRSSSSSGWGSNSSPSYSSSSSYRPSSSSSSWGSSSSPSYSSSSNNYSPSYSSSSSYSPSSSSSSWGSSSSPSYSSSSNSYSPSSLSWGSSWRSNSSPSYSSSSSSSSSSPSSTSYGFSWGSSSSPSYTSSSNWRNSGSPSFSSSSNRETTGTSNNAGSSSYSSSNTNFNPSGRSWGSTDSTKSSSNTSGNGISSSSRSPSYSSSSSNSNGPSSSSSKHEDNSKSGSKEKGANYSPSSSSSKKEDNNKSDSKAISGGASKINSSNTPNSSSNTNAESSSSSSHRPSNNVHSRTVFDVIRNRNIIRNATASGNNSNTTYGSFYRAPSLNQMVFNNPTNPRGSMVQNLNTMPLHTTINLINNNQRSAARRPYYGDIYHSYSNYDERSLETPPYSREDDSNGWQSSYYTERENYLPIDKVSKPIETEKICKNVIQGEYNVRDAYVESIKKICEPEITAQPSSSILETTTASPASFTTKPYATKASDASIIEQKTSANSRVYEELTQSEIKKRYAKLKRLKEICELARTQIPIETTTMPPTSTTYFIDYKNRKPSKLVIMPTLAGATNCRKIMKSDLNEDGQIVDIVEQICLPPTTTETPTTTTTTTETMITDDLLNKSLTAIDELIPQELKVSNERAYTSINNSAHRKQGSNPVEIICGKIMHIEVKAITDIPFKTTTIPPTSTTYYMDYKNRKPSKLVIISSQEDAPKCRKVMNSKLNEEGEIVDTVTQICDPTTTTTEATVTSTTTAATNISDTLISLINLTTSPF